MIFFFFSSRRRHTRCALVTGVQTCALPISPAVFISHGLSVPMLSVDHSAKLAGFADELLAKLAGLAREGRKLLFVDDINDSGSTVTYIREMLAKQGAVAETVRFAVLINNICSRASVDTWSWEIDRTMHKDGFVRWEEHTSELQSIMRHQCACF